MARRSATLLACMCLAVGVVAAQATGEEPQGSPGWAPEIPESVTDAALMDTSSVPKVRSVR